MDFAKATLVHTDEGNPVKSTGSGLEIGSIEPGTRSSAGEHPLHTGRVAGSIPAASTISLTGQRFGRLVVIGEIRGRGAHTRWLCQCDCGKATTPRATHVKSGASRSCGCVVGRWRHGMASSREYRILEGIVTRCTKTDHHNYAYYGGRGVRVCDRWRFGEGDLSGIECFLADIGPAPTKAHTVDRIDVNGNYEPGNCRWATRKEQARNFRRNIWVEYKGERRLLIELCEAVGMNPQVAKNRIERGWSVEDAVHAPCVKGRGGVRPRYDLAKLAPCSDAPSETG